MSLHRRFAFYDQIHTTGMDIKHALNARAALTLGKDMTFRDLAQGAFRMRGIGEGQTVACANCEGTGEVVCINCQGSGLTVPDDFIRKLGGSEVGFSEDDYIGLFDEVKFPTIVNVDASDPMERVRTKAAAEVAAQTVAPAAAPAAKADDAAEPVDFTGGMG